jgi:hypothetical protein
MLVTTGPVPAIHTIWLRRLCNVAGEVAPTAMQLQLTNAPRRTRWWHAFAAFSPAATIDLCRLPSKCRPDQKEK